jgi:hypothetical protein
MAISNDKDKPHLRSVNGPSPIGAIGPSNTVLPRHRRPKYTGTELRKALTAYDRQPFTDLLVEWFANCPRPEDIRLLAQKEPARWIQAMASLSKMAGFTDRTETSLDVTVNYKGLSDSQIEDRLRQLALRLNLPTERLLTMAPEEPGSDESDESIPETIPETIPEDIQDDSVT